MGSIWLFVASGIKKKPVKATEAPPINNYGCRAVGCSQLEYEMWAFVNRIPIEDGALPRNQHFKNICAILFPDLDWNEWLERQIDSVCENQWVCWAGCAGSGKTFAAALYAVVWWLSWPEVSSVILTSTTKGMIRRRAWPVIQKFYTQIPGTRFGNMVDSKTTWQSQKGDDKHAIFALAVAEGSTQKAVAQIQGVHTKRQLIIIDEATDTPDAAFEACANLFNGCEDFQCIVIGNPHSHFDPMGKFAEPKGGWSSITVEDEEWETVVQLNGQPGLVVRFDSEKSPNVKAGLTKYSYLITEAQLAGARRKYGEESPLFWKYQRGFWPPDGLIKTVFTESAIAKMRAMDKAIFTGSSMMTLGGLDPAFGGGDKPILRFAKCGQVPGGGLVIELEPPITLKIQSGSSNPVHFQLAEQTQMYCEKRKCPPENLAVDATGEGGGLADILARSWSPRIMRVEFGGKASDLPVSADDVRPCNEVYDRRVTELWFNVKEFLLAGQIRGLDVETAFQFTNRRFSDEKRRIVLETKLETRKAIGRSPDEADATVLIFEGARRRGIFSKPIYTGEDPGTEWEKSSEKAQESFEVRYEPEEYLEEEEA